MKETSPDPDDDTIHKPHDNFARKWNSDPLAAADFLKVVVPDSLKPLITPSNLILEPVSFIDQKLRPTQSDLLWKCQPEGADQPVAYFYILWEHQSSVDRWMSLRLFCYMARIWERWLLEAGDEKADKKARVLPLIFPIVLYQGKADWNAPQSLSELVGETISPDLKPFFPDFKFHLEAIKARPETDFPPGLAQLGVSVLKLMWDDDFIGWLQRVGDQLLELQSKGQGDKLSLLLVYAFTQVERSNRDEFINYIQQNLDPMTTTGKSLYDALIEEGEERGVEKGIEKGQMQIIRNLKEHGMSIEEITKVSGLTVEQVIEFLKP